MVLLANMQILYTILTMFESYVLQLLVTMQ